MYIVMDLDGQVLIDLSRTTCDVHDYSVTNRNDKVNENDNDNDYHYRSQWLRYYVRRAMYIKIYL